MPFFICIHAVRAYGRCDNTWIVSDLGMFPVSPTRHETSSGSSQVYGICKTPYPSAGDSHMEGRWSMSSSLVLKVGKDCWIPTLPRKWSKVFHDSLPSTRHELVSFFCAVPWLTMSLIVSRYSRGAVPAKPPASWEGWSATRVVVLGQVSMSVHTVSVKELSLLFVRKPGWSCLKRSDLKSSLW